jgi:hypothetical protein
MIDDYPAIRNWLRPFRKDLENRATKQEWWELQQAQLAYQETFGRTKIVYQDITASNPFALDESNAFLANTCYFIPGRDFRLLALLNAKLAWFFFRAVTNIARGGYLRLRSDFVEQLPIPDWLERQSFALIEFGQTCTDAARQRYAIAAAVRHRILDLAPPERRQLNGKLENWHELDFAGFQTEVRKAFHADIPVKQRGDWETYLADNARVVHALATQIAGVEQEIDKIVYELFDLTSDEIALLESSVAGRS